MLRGDEGGVGLVNGSAHTERDSVSVRVPFRASSAAVARTALVDWLSGSGARNGEIEDAKVVVSELVGNSIRHARPLRGSGDLVVGWRLEQGSVVISVSDGGAETVPRRLELSPTAESGRGMGIVEALSDDWWVEMHEDGTTGCTVHVRMRF